MQPPLHMKVLIVEDEPKVAQFIKAGLEENGYEAEIAFDGNMGLRLAINHAFDIILLDINLPGMNGYSVCRQMRAAGSQIPIIMLTAFSTTDDKLEGFDAGADDYLPKPFEFKELLARMRALLKRSKDFVPTAITPNSLVVGDLELNLDKKTATRQGNEIVLTAKEFQLLEYLMQNKNKVVSRVDIAEKVWEITFDTGTNVIDVYVSMLRKKIDKNYATQLIHTSVGMGYILKDQ
jgi:two-component system, OmpR family, copper resistance phosphate regulon response regulator CusR